MFETHTPGVQNRDFALKKAAKLYLRTAFFMHGASGHGVMSMEYQVRSGKVE